MEGVVVGTLAARKAFWNLLFTIVTKSIEDVRCTITQYFSWNHQKPSKLFPLLFTKIIEADQFSMQQIFQSAKFYLPLASTILGICVRQESSR